MKDRHGRYLLPLDYVIAWDGVRYWLGWVSEPEDDRVKIRVDGCSFETTVYIDQSTVLRLPNDPDSRKELLDRLLFNGENICLA